MTGTINDLMDENARLKTKVEELEAALKERLRFMAEHFEQNGKELGRAMGKIDKLEVMWEKLKESLLERAKGCGISSPVDLKRIQHFVNVSLAEMTALETAGPTEGGKS